MEWGKYLLAGLVGGYLGFYNGVLLDRYNNRKPYSVEVKDMNGDGRVDLIVKNRTGEKWIYLQREDGSYTAWQGDKSTEVEKNVQRKTIEEKVKL